MTELEPLATGLYWACTDFLIEVSALAGISYRDANAFLFFVLWPAVTLGLLAVAIGQAVALRRLGRPASGLRRWRDGRRGPGPSPPPASP